MPKRTNTPVMGGNSPSHSKGKTKNSFAMREARQYDDEFLLQQSRGFFLRSTLEGEMKFIPVNLRKRLKIKRGAGG